MKGRHLAFVAAVFVVLATVGMVVGAGPAAALNGSISPDPRTSNATASQHNVGLSVEEGDAVTEAGIETVIVDYGADERFNGSVARVSGSDVRAFVNGSPVDVASVATNDTADRVTITLAETTPVAAGQRVIARIENVTNPSPTGEAFYRANVTLRGGSNATDATNAPYALVPASLDFDNQTVAPDGDQNLTVRGTIPNRGYVAVFTTTDNGTAGDLLGVTPSIPPNFNERQLTNLYPLALDGNLSESRTLCAVAYYETMGGSQSVRARQSFNRTDDAAFRNDGVVVNDTALVSVEGSSNPNGTAPTTCRPRPSDVTIPNRTDSGTNGTENATNGTDNATNGSASATNGSDNATTTGAASNATTTNMSTTTNVTTTANETANVITTPMTTTETAEPTTTTPMTETAAPTTEPATTEPLTNETTTDGETTTPTPTGTDTPTAEPTATDTPEPTTTSSNGPGFGVGLAIVAVLGTIATLAVARRRQSN